MVEIMDFDIRTQFGIYVSYSLLLTSQKLGFFI